MQLLAEVKQCAQMQTAPRGREGCGDCEILEKVVGRVAARKQME